MTSLVPSHTLQLCFGGLGRRARSAGRTRAGVAPSIRPRRRAVAGVWGAGVAARAEDGWKGSWRSEIASALRRVEGPGVDIAVAEVAVVDEPFGLPSRKAVFLEKVDGRVGSEICAPA